MSATITRIPVAPRHVAQDVAFYVPHILEAQDCDGVQPAAFESDMGYMARCQEELDAYSNSQEELDAYLAANPSPVATVSQATIAAALATPFTDDGFTEERAAFQAVTGYAARSVTELEAWMDGPETLAAFVAANPLPVQADANPYADAWDALTAVPVTPSIPAPAVKAMPAPITTPPAPRSLLALKLPELRAAFAAHYGIDLDGVPSTYTRKRLVECMDGTSTPGGPRFKAAMKRAAEAKAGYQMPTTWKASKLAGYVAGTQAPPKTTVAKTALVAKVLETFGHVPKNTTVARLEKCLATGTAPRQQTNMNPWVKRADGLTAVKCLELIRAAKANGMEIKGYSKLKADDLRALVASLGLAK